jgi:L-cysteine/cystine lyase
VTTVSGDVSTRELTETRALFPVLSRVAYLNAGAVGPLSRPTHEAMIAAQEEQLAEGRGSASDFARLRAAGAAACGVIAGLLRVPADRVILTTSTTAGCNTALRAMGIGPGDEVITTNNEHPGLTAPLAASGAHVRVASVIDRTAGEVLESILSMITPRTSLIALSHVGWMNGQVLPVTEVKRRSRLPVLVDGAQSVGAIPVDAASVDFYTVSGQKWLCGPEATGALYIAEPERWKPGIAGFLAEHESGVLRYQFVLQARETLAGLVAAIGMHPVWGPRRAAEMTQQARRMLGSRYKVVGDADEGTMFSVVAPGDADACVARAQERGVIVRTIPGRGWVRVSCGYWTTEDDIERLSRALPA